jgi:hypothetical protein
MNELMDLGPNTAHMNQKPQNPFAPGDRVVKSGDGEASVAVVVEVLPPEKDVGVYGQSMEGEAVRVAFPSTLDKGPGDWRTIDPALFSSYCDDQDITLYNYKHTNLEFATNSFVPGDRVVKASHDHPDEAIVVDCSDGASSESVSVVYTGQIEADEISPGRLASHCEDEGIKRYSYSPSDLKWAK